MIKIEHLYKTYNPGKKNEEKVLKDVSLEFDRTGLVCLLGESGSGKTTLLNTIGGLDTFSGGTITIDQTTLKGYNPKVMEPIRNDRFDYIFQNYYLLGDHTVGYNVKLALNRFDISEEEKEDTRAIANVLKDEIADLRKEVRLLERIEERAKAIEEKITDIEKDEVKKDERRR